MCLLKLDPVFGSGTDRMSILILLFFSIFLVFLPPLEAVLFKTTKGYVVSNRIGMTFDTIVLKVIGID